MKPVVHPLALLAALVLVGAQGCSGSTTPGSSGSSGAAGSAGADAGGAGAGGSGEAGTDAGVECGATRCGAGQICVVETIGEAVGHFCKANPCGTQTLSCTCAASVCETNDVCSITPPSTVSCTCPTCV